MYERIIHEEVRRRLGGNHSADLLLRCYDFAQIEKLQAAGDWGGAGRILAADARRLEQAGAHVIVLCTNTMHRVAPAIEAAIGIPLLHIADATARTAIEAGVSSLVLLGTRFTMEEPFLRERLEAHGLDVRVPDGKGRDTVHAIIYEELVRGLVRSESRAAMKAVIDQMRDQGIEGVVAGCTEIELLIGPDDVAGLHFLPTARIHAIAAATAALSNA